MARTPTPVPTPAQDGRKPGQQPDATAPALPLDAAAEASPSADGPKPAGADDDAMIAEMAFPVSSGTDGGKGPQ